MESSATFITGKTQMENFKDFKNCCLVCGSRALRNITTGYSRYWPRLFKKVAACQDCGHIQLNPLYSAKEYEQINTKFFSKVYLVNRRSNVENNGKKLKKLEGFLGARISSGLRVLDVGAGEAWALPYFMKKCGNYSAIEEVPELCASIRDNGGRVIATSLNSDLSDFNGTFDVIIFRHVIEHLLEPKRGLEKLRSLLSENGVIFLALPNSSQPGAKKGFRTSYLRPVHISYFCEGNCRRLVMLSGFKVLQHKVDGEIQFLLGKASSDLEDIGFQNYYNDVLQVFKAAQKKALFKDIRFFIKDILKALFGGKRI